MAKLSPVIRQQAFDLGISAPGAKLYTFLSGTSTPQPVYLDTALSVAAENPVVADITGRFPAFWLAAVAYRMTLVDADDVTIWGPTDGISDFDPPVPPVVVPGATTQLIFNDAGALAGDAGLTYDKTTDTLTAGTLIAGNNVRILNRDVVVQDVVSSTTETTVYTFSVPAGTLGTTRMLRLIMVGDYLNNSGGVASMTLRVKYGASTILSCTHGSFTANASRRALRTTADLSAANSATAQIAHGVSIVSDVASVAGSMLVVTERREGMHNAVAENSANELALSVTVQHDVNNANTSFRCQVVQLELL